eukprot:5162430-Prymnesium_polylepis.1
MPIAMPGRELRPRGRVEESNPATQRLHGHATPHARLLPFSVTVHAVAPPSRGRHRPVSRP